MVTSVIIGGLFIALFCWRFYILHIQAKNNRRKSKIEDLVFAYLNNEKPLIEIKQYLEMDPDRVPAFIDICRHLLKDLQGDLKEQIQHLFDIKIVQQHFLKMLQSSDIGNTADALTFYKNCRELEADPTKLIKKLVHHSNSEIGFASSLALVESDRLELQYYALKEICTRTDITKMSVLELILLFSDTTKTDFNTRGEKLLKLTNADGTIYKFRLVLIKALGEMNYLNQAEQLFELLEDEIDKDERDENLVQTLIVALGQLFHQEVLPIIRICIATGNSGLKIACAKALGALQVEESISLLDTLLDSPDKNVQYEAMLQLLKIGDEVLGELHKFSEPPYPLIEEQTLSEIREISNLRYG